MTHCITMAPTACGPAAPLQGGGCWPFPLRTGSASALLDSETAWPRQGAFSFLPAASAYVCASGREVGVGSKCPWCAGEAMDGERAVLGCGEVPVLAGDPALKSAQTQVGHVPVCRRQLRGAGTCPPARCLAHSCCPGETGAVAGGVPGVGLSAGGEQGRTRRCSRKCSAHQLL